MPFLNTFGAASAKSFGLSRKKGSVGQITYSAAGTYSFTVPAGVTKMSVVYINGGYRGGCAYFCAFIICCCPCTGFMRRYSYAEGGAGGNGGRLYYKNCISVTAGQTFTVTVGSGNGAASDVTTGGVSVGYTAFYNGGSGFGGASGFGGYGGNPPASANGGNGGNAGGYTAAGANGSGSNNTGGSSTSVNGTSPGGGVSGGGGGRGGYISTNNTSPPTNGNCGAVKIIWTYAGGPTRAYPATNVGDL